MKHGVRMAAALAMTAALASPSAAIAADPGPELELRRVLLSSGGVGYFEYEATLQGAADLPLSVRRDQVDDVLKSLVVFDDAGNVGEVSLPGKELASEAFRDLPISEEALNSPAALLAALRGAEVRVESAGNVITGRIISVTEEQKKVTGGEIITQHRLSLLADGALRQVVVEEIQSLKVLDEGLQKQLDDALDALSRQRERDVRELRIHLDGEGSRVVRVGYVVEVPLWKSTYRLVLPAAAEATTAALTGFAVVENRSGEAWNDVDLTLVSGNPVTFRQAIYDTYYVNRPSVPVEVLGRVLPRPDESAAPGISAPAAEEEAGEDMAALAPPSGGFHFGFGGGARLGAPKRAPGPSRVAPIIPAEGSENATQVVFHLPTPVSVGSGQTALLPVLSLTLPASRVSLYQPDIEARHPLSSVALTNDSTTDLPPGVLAIYEHAADGGELTYAGDAQLSLLPAGQKRFVSYAVDLRITIDREMRDDQTITVATIADGALKLTRNERRTTTYTLVGDVHDPRTVVLEHPRIPGFELAKSSDYEVMMVTATHYRLRRVVPAGATIKLNVILERAVVSAVALAGISSDQLEVYAGSTELPAQVRAALGRIIERKATVAAKELALSERKGERTRILEDQTRLRENLKAVPAGSDLAKKYLGRLDTQEERLSALDNEIAAAEAAVAAARAALAAEIRSLHA